MTDPPTCASPDPHPQPPKAEIPKGSCDCHFHVFDGPSQQVAGRSYTAPSAPLTDYRAVQAALGLERGVIVQPSVYGDDNRTTLQVAQDASFRAVVVVDDDITAAELKNLTDRGAVAARVNLLFASNVKTNDFASLARRIADVGWHLQMLADVGATPDLETMVTGLPVPVVFDHLGHVPARRGVDDPGFRSLLRLMDTGRVWVKLSGAYRIDSDEMAEASGMAQALIATNPERLVWGSDWPHPAVEGAMPNDGALLDLLFDWTDTATAKRILVDNPARLYGFRSLEGGDAQ